MFNFILTNIKSIFTTVMAVLTLYLVGRNSKLSKQNDSLNKTALEQSKNIEVKKEVINVIQKTKPCTIVGNVKRMRNNKL